MRVDSRFFLILLLFLLLAFGINYKYNPSKNFGVSLSPQGVLISWIDNADNEDNFELERKIGSGSFNLLESVGSSPGISSTITRSDFVGSGQTYSYRVRACNSAGCSPYAGPAGIAIPESPPTGLIASNFGNTVSLSWIDSAQNEAGYVVERRTSSSAFVVVANIAQNSQSYTEVISTPGTYEYRVKATNLFVGDSAYSSSVFVSVQTAPATPSGLVASLS